MPMNDFLSALARRTPEIALTFLAARQGGPLAVAEFQRGLYEAAQERDARARQAQLDEERRQLQATQEARAQSAEQRAIETAERQREEAERRRALDAIDRLDRFRTQLGETAADPVAAENALLGRATALEGLYGLPPAQLSPHIPNMAPVVTRGLRADARQLLSDAEAKAAKVPGATVDESVSFDWVLAPPRVQNYLRQTGHQEGTPFKPSQLREIGGTISIGPPVSTLTYGDLFPQAKGTPQGAIPAPLQNGRVDLNEASLTAARFGWITDKASERQLRDAAVTTLRERLRYVMSNPGAGGAAPILRQLRAYGLDPEVEIDKAAREIEAANISRARTLSLIEDAADNPDATRQIPTADEIRRGFTFAADPVARGRAIENIQRGGLPGPVGTRQPVPNAVYDFVPGQGLVPAR